MILQISNDFIQALQSKSRISAFTSRILRATKWRPKLCLCLVCSMPTVNDFLLRTLCPRFHYCQQINCTLSAVYNCRQIRYDTMYDTSTSTTYVLVPGPFESLLNNSFSQAWLDPLSYCFTPWTW